MIGMGVGVVVMVRLCQLAGARRMIMAVERWRPLPVGLMMVTRVVLAVFVDVAVRVFVFVALRVCMAVTMAVAVPVGMAVGVVMPRVSGGRGVSTSATSERQGHAVGLAGPGAFPLAKGAALDQTLHMVVVALLGQTHLLLEPQHLGPVFA